MGQTPPNDIAIRTTRGQNGDDWWVVQLDPINSIKVHEVISGPLPDYARALVGWRIAGHYTRPVITSLEGWTLAHQDGWCGSDKAGCPHCSYIAERHDTASPTAKLVLENRRNLPFGYGNAFHRDPDAAARAPRLEVAP